jgi:hypothetical protein
MLKHGVSVVCMHLHCICSRIPLYCRIIHFSLLCTVLEHAHHLGMVGHACGCMVHTELACSQRHMAGTQINCRQQINSTHNYVSTVME